MMKNHVALFGIPFDLNSSYLRGCALGPDRIRNALHCGSSNLCSETGTDLETESRFSDAGNLSGGHGHALFDKIEPAIAELIGQSSRVLALGGDHSVTIPIIRAYAKEYEDLGILHLDAHPDLYDEFDGNRFSHACVFARIKEEFPNMRIVQAGIRTLNPTQRKQAERFGIEIIGMDRFHPEGIPDFNGPVYVSLDMDVLDPAFAPGVSHYEPGGMPTRDVLKVIHGLHTPLVGADIVEYNPTRDINDMTAMAAAKFVKEIAAVMLAGG